MEINCDVGEVSREIDDAILPWVSACNVCCGEHAGDEELIVGTICEAIRLGVSIGAHPSWPDRENFGRRSMNLAPSEFKATMNDQIRFIKSLVEAEGSKLDHVKPHGALYHDVIADTELARQLYEVVKSIDPSLVVYGMAGSVLEDLATTMGVRFVHEVFGDRRYDSRFKLRSRSESDALIDNEKDFQDHWRQLVSGKISDISGQVHSVPVESICIHSDTPNAIQFARLANEL